MKCPDCDSQMPPKGKHGFFKNGIDNYFHCSGCPSKQWRTVVIHDGQINRLRKELEKDGYTVLINKPVPYMKSTKPGAGKENKS